MKTVYFVDSENVGEHWLDIFSKNPQDEFIVFYSEKSPKISYDKVTMLLNSSKKPTFIHVNTGKNALDFQLVSSLGYILHGHPTCRYIILSNDTGFDSVCQFWQDKNKNVLRLSLNDALKQNEENIEIDQEVQTEVQTTTQSDVNIVLSCFSSSAQGVHQALLAIFGKDKGKSLYDSLKSKKNHLGNPLGSKEERFNRYTNLLKPLIGKNVELPEEFNDLLYDALIHSEDKKQFKKEIQLIFSGQLKQKVNSHFVPLFQSFKEILK